MNHIPRADEVNTCPPHWWVKRDTAWVCKKCGANKHIEVGHYDFGCNLFESTRTEDIKWTSRY